MSDEPAADPVSDEGLVVPKSIADALDAFDKSGEAPSAISISGKIGELRQKLENPTKEENMGAWAEALAFSVTGRYHGEKPWGTWFGPMGSGTDANGNPVYFPDVRQANKAILDHWKKRSRVAASSMMKARYSDLVWDFSVLIAGEKREVEFAKRACENYIELSEAAGNEIYEAFNDAERALTLALEIGDTSLRDRARAALLKVHKRSIVDTQRWWHAFDVLNEQPKAGTTPEEYAEVAADLEAMLVRSATAGQGFDPHGVDSAAKRLSRYYQKIGKREELPRLWKAVGKAFEEFGALASPMLAASSFQTSMDAYRQAGLDEDAHRLLGKMEKANLASVEEMQRFEHTIEIPKEEVEKFLAALVVDSLSDTLSQIAVEFLVSRKNVEKSLADTMKTSPLLAMIPKSKLSGDRIVASIGSYEDDPIGALIERADMEIGMATTWLGWALSEARTKHVFDADMLTEWCNRAGLFGDGALLKAGFQAWLADDHLKALHILVPQVEAGLRRLVGHFRRPTTKPHKQMKQARVVVTMGDMLTDKETAPAIGPRGDDLVLHFRTFFADPRGHNLRNTLAHGLLPLDAFGGGNSLWVVHAILMLGAWLVPVEQPSGQSDLNMEGGLVA